MRAQENHSGAKVLPLRRGPSPVSPEGRDAYLRHIDALLPSLPDARREAARADFAKLAFPTSKQELWKYTSLSPLVRTEYQPALTVAADEAGQAFETADVPLIPGAPLLVLVNGQISPALSRLEQLPKGVVVGSLADAYRAGTALAGRLGTLAPSSEHALVALSTALWRDGVVVHVPADVSVPLPLQLVHLHVPGAVPSATYPRLVVLLERGSKLDLVESHHGGGRGKSFSAPVSELWVGPSARLSRIVLAWEEGLHLSHTRVSQGADSIFRSSELSWGNELCRSELNIHFAEPGGACTLDGLYLTATDEQVDHQTLIDHAVPHCTSEELFKGVLGSKSTAVFHGRLLVRPDAQKSNASQTNKNLLLAPDATVNTKPGLEIYADDVKAAHGAAIGQLDPAQLFYLRARGIGLTEAKQMLTYAFAKEVVDRLEHPELRAQLDERVQGRLLTLATGTEVRP